MQAVEDQSFKVFSSSIKNTVTVKMHADKTGLGTFRLIDYSGRVVKQQPLVVQVGANDIVINNLENIIPGNYVILINMDNKKFNQKVIKF
jgi:hypothetical protein